MKTKTIDLLKEGFLLPPNSDKCQQCSVKHPLEQPHDGNSLFYKYWFRKQYDRWPTWKDALEHCSPEIKKFWQEKLTTYGISL